jgi:serine/threonine-protein kinase Chk1
VNVEDHRVAACKLISLSENTTEKDRKMIDKEMRVHSALKHENVLEFMNAVVVEPKHRHHYVPGIYMLLEFAAGGDLFDKIGGLSCASVALEIVDIVKKSSRCWCRRRSRPILF